MPDTPTAGQATPTAPCGWCMTPQPLNMAGTITAPEWTIAAHSFPAGSSDPCPGSDRKPALTIPVVVSRRTAALLAVLASLGTGRTFTQQVGGVIGQLIDHAQQGVYRGGSWERGWLEQAFGDEWETRTRPDMNPRVPTSWWVPVPEITDAAEATE